MNVRSYPNDFRMGEDLIFSMLVHTHLKKIAFVDKAVYYYRFGGVTSKSNPTFLSDIKKQYRIKEDLIRQYDYFKALPYIKYELINCFYSYSMGLLVKDDFSEEDIRQFITGELDDEIYAEATTDIELNERGISVKKHNIDKIVNNLMENKKREKRVFRAKQMLFRLLN